MGLPDGDSAGVKLLIFDSIFSLISIILLCLRAWGITLKKRSCRCHDYLAFLALVSRGIDLIASIWLTKNSRSFSRIL